MKYFRILLLIATGGGILANLNATELNSIINSGCTTCQINTPYSDITNNSDFSTANSSGVEIQARIGTFTNYGDIRVTGNSNQSIAIRQNGYVEHFINYGTMERMFWIDANSSGGVGTLTNYGTMGGVKIDGNSTMLLNNYGIIGTIFSGGNKSIDNLQAGSATLQIQTYTLKIDESATTFKQFKYGNNGNTSHLSVNGSNIRFKDGKSKIMLDFGANFELGKEYDIGRVVVDAHNNTALGVDFSRLSTFNDIYTLTKSGTNGFKAEIAPQYGTMGTLYKSNIRTMNNFSMISESMIYPHKYKSTNRTTKKRVIRRIKKTAGLFDDLTNTPPQTPPARGGAYYDSPYIAYNDSFDFPSIALGDTIDSPSLAEGDKGGGFNTQNNSSAQFSNNKSTNPLAPSAREGEVWDSFSTRYGESILLLKQNESFAYKSNSLLLADSQSEQRAKRLQNSTQNLNTRSVNPNQSQNTTTNRIAQNNNYYFILTPFVNHNYFFESGRYNLSGLEYGFVTAFSGKLNNTNSLGTHFIFSYGSLNDKDDSVFNIKSMNLNLGLNYKLDLIYAMYLKARIDGFYFMNEVQNTMSAGGKIKPNAIGFGASVSYGKEWDFRDYGLLGLEVALDYKGLYASETTINVFRGSTASYSDIYKSALYNMLYVDLGLNYDKYFSTSVGLWGLNTGLGVKANATANKLATSKILNGNRNLNMTLDNDLVLAYLNVGGSYVLNTKDFDMEFSLAYYGSYGDRVMSNGGGFEWRVGW